MWFLFMFCFRFYGCLSFDSRLFCLFHSVASVKHKKLDLCWAHLQTNRSDIHQNYTQATKLLFLLVASIISTMNSIIFWLVLSTKMTFLMKKSCFSTLLRRNGAPLSCRTARVSSHFSIKMIKWAVTTY